jgi:dTDP-4-amino-4,6-dideoxygalactose transaminase
MALMALGIKQEDEVIVPNRTWVATAHAPLFLGAKTVLSEVRGDIPQFDINKLKAKITNKTKVIIPVHLNGRSEDMNSIREIADEYNLFIVEDACQGFLSKNSNGFLGTQSDISCFSLGVTKLMATGQGGFLLTSDSKICDKLKKIRWHGVGTNIEPEYSFLGCNFKFNDILASIGLVQLARIQDKIDHLILVYNTYLEGIKNLPFIHMLPVNRSTGEIPLYVEAMCNDAEKLSNYLQSKNIDVRPFLPNLDTATYFNNTDTFPVSEKYAKNGVTLPCGPTQPLENVNKVLDALKAY